MAQGQKRNHDFVIPQVLLNTLFSSIEFFWKDQGQRLVNLVDHDGDEAEEAVIDAYSQVSGDVKISGIVAQLKDEVSCPGRISLCQSCDEPCDQNEEGHCVESDDYRLSYLAHYDVAN